MLIGLFVFELLAFCFVAGCLFVCVGFDLLLCYVLWLCKVLFAVMVIARLVAVFIVVLFVCFASLFIYVLFVVSCECASLIVLFAHLTLFCCLRVRFVLWLFVNSVDL